MVTSKSTATRFGCRFFSEREDKIVGHVSNVPENGTLETCPTIFVRQRLTNERLPRFRESQRIKERNKVAPLLGCHCMSPQLLRCVGILQKLI
jgi:hypothetical protein